MSTINRAHPNRSTMSPFFIATVTSTIALVVVAAVVAFLQ